VVTGDDETAGRLRLLRDHGRRGRDEHLVVGLNSRMDALQAAVLSAKLPRLDRWTLARRAMAERYRAELGSMIDWQPPALEQEVHHIFPVLVEGRDDVQRRLLAAGIATGVHYRHALSTIDAFGSPDRCPVAE
jgi:dTDP-4-amino-4,6-dideoxygalactose transaminase